jgi:metal-responsive CopG/Arc/MetJ family transcriptional regulator
MKESLLTFWLDEALEQQLNAACAVTGRSRSEIVREALRCQLRLLRFEDLRGQGTG